MTGHRWTGGDWLWQAERLCPSVLEPSGKGGAGGGRGAGWEGGGHHVREKKQTLFFAFASLLVAATPAHRNKGHASYR